MPFLDSLDIANSALQKCGASRIESATEDSKSNTECSFAYDKLRRPELRRNVWRFAIKKTALRAIDTTTLLLDPPLYDATKTYLLGAIVKDANGQLWTSLSADNINNTPGGNNEDWDSYFGPLTVSLYSSETSYSAGELVYKAGAVAGSYQIYLSLTNNNDEAPDVATAWDVDTTYYANQVVSYSGDLWRSLLAFNVGTTPADGPLAWDSTATYSTSQTVTGSDNFIYSSVGSGNTGHDPTTDGGVHWTNTNVAHAWSRSPTLTTGGITWRAVGAALAPLSILYPLGGGPLSDTTTRNVFRLPAGFLREAPQNPKAGSTSYLGAPCGLPYADWEPESEYFVSGQQGPIVFRFVADITIVSKMDDMFCEGLACRIATAVCQPLTQSGGKLGDIASAYNKFMSEARTVNAVETGATEPPIDDYIECRG